jgi:hypothetical protein
MILTKKVFYQERILAWILIVIAIFFIFPIGFRFYAEFGTGMISTTEFLVTASFVIVVYSMLINFIMRIFQSRIEIEDYIIKVYDVDSFHEFKISSVSGYLKIKNDDWNPPLFFLVDKDNKLLAETNSYKNMNEFENWITSTFRCIDDQVKNEAFIAFKQDLSSEGFHGTYFFDVLTSKTLIGWQILSLIFGALYLTAYSIFRWIKLPQIDGTLITLVCYLMSSTLFLLGTFKLLRKAYLESGQKRISIHLSIEAVANREGMILYPRSLGEFSLPILKTYGIAANLLLLTGFVLGRFIFN